MRTHKQIIVAAEGPTALAKLIGADAGVVKQWKRLDSIPAPYWSAVAAHGVATLEELAEAAEAKRVSRTPTPQGAAA